MENEVPSGAVNAFHDIIRSASSSYAPRALAAWSLLELERDDPSTAAFLLQRFIADFPGHQGIARIDEALSLLQQYQDLPRKSETLAGILSAILPGAGYVYVGRYGDGLTSFLVNALFVAGTVTAVNNDWIPAAGFSDGIGLPFYMGNIYGSANAAKKWNRTIRNKMRDRIIATLENIVDEKNFSLKLSSDEAVPLSSSLKRRHCKSLPDWGACSFHYFTNIITSVTI